MFFTSIKACVPGYESDNAQQDFKNSTKYEKFRLGNEAVFIPDGFGWKYFPLSRVKNAKKVKRTVSSDNGVAPFSMDAPAIILEYDEDIIVLDMNNEKKTIEFFELLSSRIGG
ncbi:MAG: hypothetical protein K6B41_03640 [Butyrivibrio sp.]|nr:hypothetical protein [Butyrivibrio sp.]